MSVDPGKGYRLLVEGDTIGSGDEFMNRGGKWEPAYAASIGMKFDTDGPRYFRPYRRLIEKPVDVHTGGPYVAIEVHRAALAEIERLKVEKQHLCAHLDAKYEDEKKLKVELNAVKKPEPEPEWFDLTPHDEHVWRNCDYAFHPHDNKWHVAYMALSVGAKISQLKQVGYTKFRCLLKDAPKVEPDPDEWVTQDRVPPRPGIDERRWVSEAGGAYGMGWIPVGKAGLNGMMHGETANGDRLELRCRRRDLPPLPEPKPETITFYEFAVRCGHENKSLQLKWRDSQPADKNWIPTGRTETREVVR